jgi:hypothetical protein
MQWHWGNIGSMLACLSALIIAAATLIRSPEALRDWRTRQLVEADAARARAEADRTEAEQVVLDRRRTLSGWSPGGVETYTVALATDPAEMEQGARELSGGVQRVTSCCASMRASTAARAGGTTCGG